MTQLTPGRIAALVAGVPVALALIGWTSYDLVALIGQASYPIAETIPLHDGGLTASLNGSDLTLRQGGTGAPTLTGTVHYSLVKPAFTVTQAGAGTSVSFACRAPDGDCGLDATLQVPSGIGVTLSTEGGNISVPVFSGSADLVSGGGDVTAGSLDGTMQVQTGGGNVNVQALTDADVTIGSGGGDVTLTFTRPPDHLRISTDGGNVNVILPPGGTAYDLRTSTDGGNLDVSHSVPADSRSAHSVSLDSGGGDITVTEG
jgi:hypothetical protein